MADLMSNLAHVCAAGTDFQVSEQSQKQILRNSHDDYLLDCDSVG